MRQWDAMKRISFLKPGLFGESWVFLFLKAGWHQIPHLEGGIIWLAWKFAKMVRNKSTHVSQHAVSICKLFINANFDCWEMQHIQLHAFLSMRHQYRWFPGSPSFPSLQRPPPPASLHRVFSLCSMVHRSLSAPAEGPHPFISLGLLPAPRLPVPSFITPLSPLQLKQSVASPKKSFWRATAL